MINSKISSLWNKFNPTTSSADSETTSKLIIRTSMKVNNFESES